MTKKNGSTTREKIVEIATELIDDRGYHGMSLEEVAKRLEVTRPALYYYYSRKDQLLLEIHNRAQTRFFESTRDIYEKDLAPLERLYLLLHNHALIAARDAGVVAVMFEEEHNLAEHERRKIREVRIEYTQRFIDAYEEGKRHGLLRADSDSRLTAFLMLGACNWITRWFKPGEWSAEYVAETVAQNVLRGVLTDKGRDAANETGLLEP